MRRARLAAIALLCAIFPMAAQAHIVLSELLWSGSDLSSSDEWIELANTGTGDVALDGWRITKLSSGEEVEMFTFPAGATVGSGGYFLVSNKGEAESRLAIVPNFVTTAVSLSNTQLLLRLYNALGELIDAVDDGVGVPFAGSNESPKASMERIALSGSGQLKENWQTATTFLNLDDGAPLFGTPGVANGTGASQDTFPPREATLLSAEVMDSGLDSGSEKSLIVSWVPSTSLDLLEQELSVIPAINATSQWSLPKTATGATFTEGIGTGTGFVFTLRSRDASGNTSSGVATISRLFPNVKITEVLANPAGVDDEEWIELGNLGSEAVDIAGWVLDEGNSPDAYVIAPREGATFILLPGEHIAFPKSLTNLPLENKGETLTLKRGATTMDEWAYNETAEEVSYGRSVDSPDTFQPFCVPTKGKPNEYVSSNPRITIQSGEPSGISKVTLNLIAEVQTGSTLHASCAFDYGDGYTSESCNPPSHTIANVGTYAIRLSYTDFCAEITERTLIATVGAPPPPSPPPPDPPPPPAGGGGSRGHGGSGGGGRTSCELSTFDGVRISEVLPNPEGDDRENEWIELENTNGAKVSLCGWQLDDGLEGSKPHPLDSYAIPPQSFLLLSRKETNITLNNTDESARLLAPNGTISEISYAESIEGESYALRSDGVYVFTPFLTPGDTNRFREAGSSAVSSIMIAAALPNPDGRDEGNEWIEIENQSDQAVNLAGWMLDNGKDGNSFALDGITVQPGEARRFVSSETGIALTNTEDAARLIDPAGMIISLLAWQDAASGQVYRPITFTSGVQANVAAIIDGDTIDVEVAGKKERVRLLGIDAPETVHPWKPLEKLGEEARETLKALLKEGIVTLHLESTTRDKYGRMLAYIVLPDGTNVNGELVRRGLARAYLRYPFGLSTLFASYEEEARRNKWGLWADEKTAEFVMQSEGIPTNVTEEEGTGALLLAGLILHETGAVVLEEEWQGELHRIFISEVMSNPPAPHSPAKGKGGPKEGPLAELGEYLELWNGESEMADLSGWILDDDPNGSSKPQILPEGTIIPAQGFLVLDDQKLKISLNNEGEDLSLSAPNGTLVASTTYPKLDRGEAYALRHAEQSSLDVIPSSTSPEPDEGRSAYRGTKHIATMEYCLTRLPTPGRENICRSPLIALKTKKEKREKEILKKKETNERQSVANAHNPLIILKTVYRIQIPEPKKTNAEQILPPLLTRAGAPSIPKERRHPLVLPALVIAAILFSILGLAFARRKLQNPATV